MSTKREPSVIGGRILWLRKSTAVTPGPIPGSRLSACTHAVLQRKRRGRGGCTGSAATAGRRVCHGAGHLPVGDFGRLMSLMRYLCENGVGLGHWLDVLDDAGQVYWPCTAANGQQESGKPARFVAFAGFEGANLVHNPELTQSV